MRPMLREHVVPLEPKAGSIRFFCSHRAQVLSYQVDDSGLKAVALADGRRHLRDIHAALAVPDLTPEDLRGFFSVLAGDRIIRDASGEQGDAFEPAYEVRLSRQMAYLSGLAEGSDSGRVLQTRLRRSRVLIIGAGGGGSHLAVQLAGIGVGALTVADGDKVEAANLGRQIYYAGRVGEWKVSALEAYLKTLAPETKVTTKIAFLEESSPWLDDLIGQSDLVLNCADHPSMDETTGWLYDACYKRRVPLIAAGGYNGHVTSLPPTLLPGRSTCWPCFRKAGASRPSIKDFGLRLSAVNAGVFLPGTIAMAALQMPEIIRVLTGHEPARFTNRRGDFDLGSCELKVEAIAPTPGCGRCEGTA